MSEAVEKVYFESGNIMVTNARFVNGSSTYAMRNVSAVSRKVKSDSVALPGLMLLVGVFMLGSWLWWLGISLIILAVFWIWNVKSTYTVILTTSGNDLSALESRNKDLIDTVVKALNQSIIDRG